MTGARRPASAAISVSLEWKGSPDGFPRGVGRAVRVETPCPNSGSAARLTKRSRRVLTIELRSALSWTALALGHRNNLVSLEARQPVDLTARPMDLYICRRR